MSSWRGLARYGRRLEFSHQLKRQVAAPRDHRWHRWLYGGALIVAAVMLGVSLSFAGMW